MEHHQVVQIALQQARTNGLHAEAATPRLTISARKTCAHAMAALQPQGHAALQWMMPNAPLATVATRWLATLVRSANARVLMASAQQETTVLQTGLPSAHHANLRIFAWQLV